MTRPATGTWWWWSVAGLLALGALLARDVPREAIDWQPGRAIAEPWRWWSAVWVHYSRLHFAANVAGALLVGALGAAARLAPRAALAWLLAWPVTQLALAIEPRLVHYGGLSGVLHAGVAIVAVHLLQARGPRWLGALLLGGLLAKVLFEAPWQGPLVHRAGWDIAIAPLAHASGAASGLVFGWLLRAPAR